MSDDLYVFDEASWNAHQRRMAELEVGQGVRTAVEPIGQAADEFLAYVPCGEILPALTDPAEVPKKLCCLFRINESGSVEPMLLPDGSPQRELVFNANSVPIPSGVFVSVSKLKTGGFTAKLTGPAPPTTTTEGPTTTTTPGRRSPCAGTCRFVWSASSQSWTLDSDGCTPASTTTSTTTTTTSTSTTTGGPTTTTTADCGAAPIPQPGTPTTCPCPPLAGSESATQLNVSDWVYCNQPTTTTAGPTTTTTDGGPTTTTTSVPCRCAYPTFCGSVDGDCTTTFCIQGDSPQPPACSTTTTGGPTTTTTPGVTTTTTAGPTTTTTEPAQCGCDWVWIDLIGWIFLTGSCAGCSGQGCKCEPPGVTDPECGDLAHTPCTCDPPPPPPPPCGCGGNCSWVWSPIGNRWFGVSRNCNADGKGGGMCADCGCDAPSAPGTACGGAVTVCYIPDPPDPTTTTTGDPSSTTTTTTAGPTTTTTANCLAGCKWRWSSTSSSWSVYVDSCGACTCGAPPSTPGIGDCEIRQVPCGNPSTTTSPTTTTTFPCQGGMSLTCVYDGSFYVWQAGSGSCSGSCASDDCRPEIDPSVYGGNPPTCSGSGDLGSTIWAPCSCGGPTTTTTAGPTTTTTPGVTTTTTPGPSTTTTPGCDGYCRYGVNGGIDNFCQSCDCAPYPEGATGIFFLPCVRTTTTTGGPTTTTTAGATTTTTTTAGPSTTTTCAACPGSAPGSCTYQWNGLVWSFRSSDCGVGETCSPPISDGANCECANIPCNPAPSTTTPSTTTTPGGGPSTSTS